MDYICVTSENIEKEHICCAISNNNDCQVKSKKSWLADRFNDGLVFLKGDVRGKLFIEYIPANKAWAPIDADNYMYIDCFWISGQFKGHGYANELLDRCIADSRQKGMQGICVLSSQKKKMPFLSDPDYLRHRGFLTADTAEPFFSLLYLPFSDTADVPCFSDSVKRCPDGKGLKIYYSDQCPYTAKYVPLLVEVAKNHGFPLETVHITSLKDAKNAPSPFTSFSLFHNGKFVTNEILNEPRLLKIAQNLGVTG